MKKTPEGIKAKLDTLSIKPRVTNAQIEKYCASAGRPFVNAEKLAAHLKTL